MSAYAVAIFAFGRFADHLPADNTSRAVVICVVAPSMAIMVGAVKRRQARDAEALLEQEARYRTVLAASPDGIALQRADLSIAAWNEAAERITGLTQEQLTGLAPKLAGWEAIREDGSRFPMHEHPSLVALQSGDVQTDSVMGIRHPDGRLVWISMNTTPLIRPPETRAYAAVTSFSDVTARRRAEAALRESEERFQLLAMQAPVGIYHTDAAGSFTFVNDRYCALTKTRPADALGDRWHQTIHPEDRNRVASEWRAAAVAGRGFRVEYRLRSPAGETIWVEGSADAVHDANGAVTGYVGSVHDLSERKLAEEALRTLSLRDELTGLWNRRGFVALGEQECRRSRRSRSTVLVMYGDVDAFKGINDTHGHTAGDDALTAVSIALRASCRDTDVIGRLGGDEFVILSVHDSAGAAALGEAAIRSRLVAHLEAASADRPFTLTLSLGAANAEGANASLDALLARSDEALYAAKRERRATLAPVSPAG